MQKETKLYGLRAILEAIEADKSIDKIFLQKGLRSELFVQLEKKIRKKGLNFSYVPVEKLNRLTRNNHQGAVAQISPISFYDLDALVTASLFIFLFFNNSGGKTLILVLLFGNFSLITTSMD